MKKVYISYPMNPKKHDLKQIQDAIQKAGVYGSIPPAGQLSNKTSGARFDKYLIENSDEVWAFGQLGRDCAWELGFAVGLNKPVKLFVDEQNNYLIEEDWMLLINAEVVNLAEVDNK
jgi:nucleoside 2-deoxyribosyltransferase